MKHSVEHRHPTLLDWKYRRGGSYFIPSMQEPEEVYAALWSKRASRS